MGESDGHVTLGLVLAYPVVGTFQWARDTPIVKEQAKN